MVLRNVAKTFSLEEQRQEINEIAVDLDAVNTTLTNWNASDWDTAYGWGDHAQQGYATQTWVTANNFLTAEADTFATVTARGATTNDTVVFGDNSNTGEVRLAVGGTQANYLKIFGSSGETYIRNDDNDIGNTASTINIQGRTGVALWQSTGNLGLQVDSSCAVKLYYQTSEKLRTTTNGVEITGDTSFTGNIAVTGTVDGRDVANDGAKLDGIESGATADQTGAEIKTAYEGEADTNAFTDAEKTKLSGIEAGATVNAATGGTSGGIGTTADPQYGSVQFRGGSNTLLGDSVFVYDTTNNRLGVGVQQPKNELHILKGVDGGDVSLRITNQSSVDAGTTASMYLGTSPSDTFNTFYIRAFRDGGATHLGYSDPDAVDHDPNIILPSAGGLEFGTQTDTETTGSTKTSATLDHYEEGTWTPQWGSTTGSITNVTYDTQSGWYTRIGRVVYVSCRLRSSATDTSGAGGGLLVNGLPFVARTPQGTGAGAAYSLIDFPAGTINITTEVRENTTQFYAGLYTLDNGNFGNIGPGSLQSSGQSEIRVSFFYMTDS